MLLCVYSLPTTREHVPVGGCRPSRTVVWRLAGMIHKGGLQGHKVLIGKATGTMSEPVGACFHVLPPPHPTPPHTVLFLRGASHILQVHGCGWRLLNAGHSPRVRAAGTRQMRRISHYVARRQAKGAPPEPPPSLCTL